MAEHYGEVPKRFTAAWWGYFWMYYKWHTIGTAFVIFAIIITAVQCAQKEKYDLVINYAATNYYANDVMQGLKEAVLPYTSDADGNGEVNVFVQQFNFSNQTGSEEMDYTLQIKHDVELSSDYSFLYIYDDEEAEMMLNRESADQTYMNIHEWVEGEIDEEDIVKTNSGAECAVRLEGSKILEELGIKTDGLCVAVRMDYSEKEYNSVSQQSAIAIANELLKK